MKFKKTFSLFLATMMIGACCLGASAASTDFGGTTSGGTTGSMFVDCYLSAHNNAAFYYEVGVVNKPFEAMFDVSVGGQLIGTNNSGSLNVNFTPTKSFTTSSSNVNGDVIVFGAASSYPPNNTAGYKYQRAVLSVSYSSAGYGTWQGSGTMNYDSVTPPPTPTEKSVDFGGNTSGGTTGTMFVDCYLSTNNSAAFYYEVGVVNKPFSAMFDVSLSGQLVGSRNGSPLNVTLTPTKSFTTSSSHVNGDVIVYGAASSYPPNNTSGYQYQRAVLTVNYTSAGYGTWQGNGTLTY